MELLDTAPLFRARVISIAFSGDGRQLAAATLGGQIAVTQADRLAAGTTVTVRHSRGSLLSLASHPLRPVIIGVGGLKKAILWDIGTSAKPTALSNLSRLRGIWAPWSAAVSPDGHLLAIGDMGNAVTLLDISDVRAPRLQPGVVPGPRPSMNAPRVRAVAFHPSGHYLAAANGDGTLAIWGTGHVSTADSRPAPWVTVQPAHADVARNVTWSADGSLLVTSGADEKTILWDPAVPAAPQVLSTIPASNFPLSTLSPVVPLLITADGDAQHADITVWDVATPAWPARVSVTETERVASFAWSPDGKVLATGHVFGSVSLWRLLGDAMTGPSAMLVAGRYWLTSVIGEGGMGIVWRARDELLERDIALKEVLLPRSPGGRERELMLSRTLREARAAARLRHPGIVTIHDVVSDLDRPWIVMELIAGAALESGVLHRDVKPGNILLEGDRVVLTDFGIASIEGGTVITGANEVIGTPEYLAPERVSGQEATPAADLWAVGVTLYAAVEGRSPFARPSVQAAIAAALTQAPDPPKHAGSLWPVIEQLLRKDPAQRPSAGQALGMLERSARRSGKSAHPRGEQAARPPDTATATPPPADPHRESAVTPVTETAQSVPRPGDPGQAPVPRKPRRRWQHRRGPAALLAASVLLGGTVIVAIGYAIRPASGHAGGVTAASSASPRPTLTGSAGRHSTTPKTEATPVRAPSPVTAPYPAVNPPPVPPGYSLYHGSTGYWIALPRGTSLQVDPSGEFDWNVFVTPTKLLFVTLTVQDGTRGTAESALLNYERHQRGITNPYYQRIRLAGQPASGNAASVADLEYTLTSDAYTFHDLMRAVVTKGGRLYMLTLSIVHDNYSDPGTTDSDWQAALPKADTILATFRPA